MSKSSSRRTSSRQNSNAPWILAIVGVILFGCVGVVAFNTLRTFVDAFTGGSATPEPVEVHSLGAGQRRADHRRFAGDGASAQRTRQ
jgi:hypothetical protein